MKVCQKCEYKFQGSDDWICPSCKKHPEIINGCLAFNPELAYVNDGFDADFFKNLFDLESNHFWFLSRNQLIMWFLTNYFPLSRSMLEIGCGTGFVLSGIEREFPHLVLSGSEIFLDALPYAKERVNRAKLFQMDARQIPYENEFDVIGVFDVLEHIEEDSLVLEQMYQACKPGGGIVITVPQHEWLWSYADEYACHKRRYTRKVLNDKVKKAGFEVIRSTSFVSLLLPLMFLSRFKTQSKESYNTNKEMNIGRLTNKLLEGIMFVERMIIKSGISMPAGGSLLLIAKKVDK